MTTPSVRPLHVFLCHSSGDKPAVRELYQRLNVESWIDVWLDENKLLPGQDWEYEIENALDNSDAVIVCLSTTSVSKEGFVQRELRFVLEIALEKPEGTIFILPVRLDDCERPRRLRSIQSVDYFPQEFRESAYTQLRSSLELRARSLRIITDEAGAKSESEIEKVKRIKAVLDLAEEILETATEALSENEKALTPLFQDISHIKTVHKNMVELYQNQRNRGDFGRWKSSLEEVQSTENGAELEEMIGILKTDVDKLHRAFYRNKPYSSYDPSKITLIDKLSLAKVLEGRNSSLENQEIIDKAESYLDYLRDLVENIGRSVGILRTYAMRIS